MTVDNNARLTTTCEQTAAPSPPPPPAVVRLSPKSLPYSADGVVTLRLRDVPLSCAFRPEKVHKFELANPEMTQDLWLRMTSRYQKKRGPPMIALKLRWAGDDSSASAPSGKPTAPPSAAKWRYVAASGGLRGTPKPLEWTMPSACCASGSPALAAR